jgi:hypothetical protein
MQKYPVTVSSVEVYFTQFIIVAEVDKEDLAVDESAPVIHTLEFETCLNGVVLHLMQMVLHVGAIEMKCLQEIVSYVETKNCIFGISVYNLLTIYAAIFLMIVNGLRQQIVGVER